MPPQIGEGLRDDADAHLQFFITLPVGLFSADRVRFVNRSQSLLDHLGSDDEITAGFMVERHVCRSSYGIEASRHADQRTGAALMSLQECFIAPVRTGAAADT